MIAWSAISWESIALAIIPAIAVWYCWGFRERMNGYAWGFYALFVATFLASNVWRLVPFPDENTAEAWRLWYGDARLLHNVAVKWCYVIGIALAFIAGFRGKMKGATALLAATVLSSSFGEAMEFSYCNLRDPWKGLEHIYRMDGGRESVCGRIAEAGLGRGFGWIGVWLAPALTAAPPLLAIAWTGWRKRAG